MSLTTLFDPWRSRERSATSVNKYKHMQRNIPQDRCSRLHSGRSLKSRNVRLSNFIFCSPASLYNLFKMKPTRCTLLLSIFISTSLHVSGNYVTIIRRTYCIHATLVFFTLCGWLSGLLQHTRQPDRQSEKYQCRIDTLSSPDDGHIVARNM